MGESFKPPSSNEGMDLESDSHIYELETLCKELKSSAFTVKKIGDGVLLVGIRIPKRSLANKLTGRYRANWSEKLVGYEEEVQRIVRKGSEDNQLWYGPLYAPKPKYNLTPGMVPLFWWPIDLDVIEAIFFHDLLLFSVYNPAHLAAKLREAGFSVESLKGRRGLKVEKKLGDKTAVVEGFEYFTHLITGQFWKEETVVRALSSMAERTEFETTPPHTKIVMQIQQQFGPKPA